MLGSALDDTLNSRQCGDDDVMFPFPFEVHGLAILNITLSNIMIHEKYLKRNR